MPKLVAEWKQSQMHSRLTAYFFPSVQCLFAQSGYVPTTICGKNGPIVGGDDQVWNTCYIESFSQAVGFLRMVGESKPGHAIFFNICVLSVLVVVGADENDLESVSVDLVKVNQNGGEGPTWWAPTRGKVESDHFASKGCLGCHLISFGCKQADREEGGQVDLSRGFVVGLHRKVARRSR